MLEQFKIHNLFWENFELFKTSDPHLSLLGNMKFIANTRWWQDLNISNGGIYVLAGGRQIGKSTSLKLFSRHLVANDPEMTKRIFYLPCDQILDRTELYRIILQFMEIVADGKFLLLIDEITFIENWERTIKALADEGRFRQGCCIVTGSDRLVLEDAICALPGRRGEADKTDFELYPLTFREFVELVHSDDEVSSEELFLLFDKYIRCGGFPKAINELLINGTISSAVYQSYQQWIIGDFLKRSKHRELLLDICKAILDTLGSQVTYSRLSQHCFEMSKSAVIDYIHLLERMGILIVQRAFDQNTLQGFPKKARKIHFADPFILEAVRLMTGTLKPVSEPLVVEGIAVSHYSRFFPTYYIKAEGEVDIVAVNEGRFHPVEIKWKRQTRTRDLRQLVKYKNATLLTMNDQEQVIEGVRTASLARELFNLMCGKK